MTLPIAPGTPVVAYRNLKAPAGTYKWSVCHDAGNGRKGTLIGHVSGADGVALANARVVERASRQAVIQAGAPREVCAWIAGTWAPFTGAPAGARRVTYRPRERAGFYESVSGAPYGGSAVAVFTEGMWVA